MTKILGVVGNININDSIFLKDLINNKYDNFININIKNIDEFIYQIKNVDFILNYNDKKFPLYQSLLDLMEVSYSGSSIFSNILSGNYIKSKEVLRFHNLPTPPYYVLNRNDFVSFEENHGYFGFPVVVKSGLNNKLNIANNIDKLEEYCNECFEFNNNILIERYIIGKKIKVGILNNYISGIAVIDNQEYNLDNIISSELIHGIIIQAKRVYEIFECSRPSMIEFILTDINEYIVSINTIPDLAINGLFMRIFNNFNTSYSEIINSII